jgi:capsular exopolysaccharide synthesis family protein
MARRRRRKRSGSEYESEDEFDDYEDQAPGRQVGTRQLIFDLLGRWYWIALCLILGLLGAFYYLSKAPKVYQATSSLFVKLSAQNLISGQDDDDELMDLRSLEAVNTLAEQIKRAGLLTKVAQNQELLAMDGLLPAKVNWFPAWSHQWLGGAEEQSASAREMEPGALGRIINSWVSVSVRRNTRLLDVTVEHPVPEIASAIADTIAREYELELKGALTEGSQSTSKLLGGEVEETAMLLQQKEQALANYEIALEALAALKEKEAIFTERDLRYLSKHPKWIAAEDTLGKFQKRFLSEFVSARDAAVDQKHWEAKRSEWDQEDLSERDLVQIARRLLVARVTLLNGEIKNQKELYDRLVTRKLQQDVNDGTAEAEVEVSEYSQVPENPTSPKKMTTLAGGGILGMGAGLAFAFLLVKLDNKIHTVLQAELLTNLPVLATIRNIEPKVLEKIIAEKEHALDELPPALKKWDPHIVFRPGLTDSLYAEMFRTLRASVTLLGDESRRNVTLFSSALPGEGKTLVSTNFAIASAQQGKKTVLVDLDLRKPTVHKAFGLKRNQLSEGITEVLAGKVTWADAISGEAGQENLSCLFAGTKAPNPGELLNSDALMELLEALGKEFDVIVLDSAPLLAVPDTRLLIPTADNLCLVLRAEQTPKAAIKKTLALLHDDGAEPAGIVINGYEKKTGLLNRKYGYGGYGYGGYGQYGKGYGYGSYGTYGSDDD